MRTAMSSIFRSWIQLLPGVQQWNEQHAMVHVVLHGDYIFFLNAGRLLRYQSIKLSWRKFLYVSVFIFTPSGTLNGPTSSLPIIQAQNMTPPPPYCMSSHSWCFAAAIYKSTSAPAIWSIECCSAFICRKNSLEVCLDILFGQFKSLISVPGG